MDDFTVVVSEDDFTVADTADDWVIYTTTENSYTIEFQAVGANDAAIAVAARDAAIAAQLAAEAAAATQMQATMYDPQGIHGDAFARANHTGTQLANTISNFSTAADARVSAAIGVTVQAYSAILQGTTASYTVALDTKLGGIAAGADVTLSALAPAVHGVASKAAPVDADEFALIDSAAAFGLKKLTVANLKAGLLAYWNLTAKAVPVDADRVWQGDSTTANTPVYSTWTQIKAFLKTYFDTLYQPVAAPLTALSLIGAAVAGNLIYGSGAGTWARLAAGTALQHLRMNAAGTAPEWAAAREVLTANRTYYVRTDGNDANTGLVNSSGGAFLTVQKALDVVATLDLSIYNVIIQVGDGTYTGAAVCLGARVGAGTVTIQGNAATPANVWMNTAGVNDCFIVQQNSSLIIKDMKLTTGNSHAIYCKTGGYVEYSNIDFGTVAFDCHVFAEDGGVVTCTGNYTISGGSLFHWRVSYGIIRCQARTITLVGTPNFSIAFAAGRNLGNMVVNGCTFSGAATGVRYDATLNSVIQTAGGGATYLPGNAAGTTATGGQYA